MAAPSCSICADLLTNICAVDPLTIPPGEPQVRVPSNVNAMVTPCGHAFHAYCVNRWLAESNTLDGSCPNCRKPIPRKKCTPLFLDTYEVSMAVSAVSTSSTGTGDDDIGALKSALLQANKECQVTRMERDTIRNRHAELEQTMHVMSNENASLNDRLTTERQSSDSLRYRYMEALSYKSYADQKETELQKVTEELDKFKYLQNVINGVRHQTSKDLKTFTSSPSSMQSLIEIKNVLQQEISSIKSKHQNHKSEKESDRKEILRLRAEVEKMKEINSDLEFRLHTAQRVRVTAGGIVASASTITSSSSSSSSSGFGSTTSQVSNTDGSTTGHEGDMDMGGSEADDSLLMTGIGVGLKRSRSGRVDYRTLHAGKTPRGLERSGSVISSGARGRLSREMNNVEPLSPLNIRFRSGIPGVAVDTIRRTGSTKLSGKGKQPWRL